MSQRLRDRFVELTRLAEEIDATRHQVETLYGHDEAVDENLLLKWKVNVETLLRSVCGDDAHHLRDFTNVAESRVTEESGSRFDNMNAVFYAAQNDFLGGHLDTLRSLVQAEVFDDELEQASVLLQAGYPAPAAVVAGVVLETAMRELCNREGIAPGKLDFMNGALAKANVYNKNQLKVITAIAGIRNSAAHGANDEYSTEDVVRVIRDVQSFLSHSY